MVAENNVVKVGGGGFHYYLWWMCYDTVFLSSCDEEFYVRDFRTQHKTWFLAHVFTICIRLRVFRNAPLSAALPRVGLGRHIKILLKS